ncbi:hypothetical protein RclHR1_02840011 [Rhizophagus clarus]|uniref:Uncharacterized protein n=1 Tax=Rhizophagus clarus TaxID=94130 RepID=A0A2Z6RFL6_9GLOM|nr:hypothetical protein RclHR1_02840011 [Rhizophagus clarus]GES95739.1 hypothetical protein GLOIN_2v1835226 [Rhizophagus clarus]
MNVSSCFCYNCNTDYPTLTSLSSNNSDKQNLILQICNGIFKAIQNEKTMAEIVCSMSHRQLRNINEVEACINEEFRQLFINNVLRKEINSFLISTWRIRLKWSEFNNDSLIRNLLLISKKWYDPFTSYLQKMNSQKRNKWFYEQNGDEGILNNLKEHLPGFKYLIEYTWRQSYYNCYGGFVFASDSGIFIEVTVNARNGRRFQASENFEGKYVTLLRATYNYDEDDSEKATLEFIHDNDEIIMQFLKEIYNNNSLQRYNNNNRIETNSLQRYDNNRNVALLRDEQIEQIAEIAAGAVVGIAAVAAVAGVGYLAYKAATNKTVRRTATAINYGYLAYSLIQKLEKENERERNDNDD